MCGISCAVRVSPRAVEEAVAPPRPLHEELNASLDKIAHRGPDARGTWVSEDGEIGLAHCRLAINDLRPSASQPLHSECGKIHAVVNGEIYDFDRLRADLISRFHYKFKTTSDSEVALVLYQHYGLDFLQHLRGEFAVCIYDERSDLFIAARDRYGIKPLYWTISDGRLLVAAEAKAFLGFGWKAEWDVTSIVEGGWNFDERTLFKRVKKVSPGHYLIRKGNEPIRVEQYWDISYPEKHQQETRSLEGMIAGVREHLLESIRLRLRADVPVGVYLSGGIDSSAIAGMVSHIIRERGEKLNSADVTDKICCFGVAFDKTSGYDESDIAQRTADWLDVRYLKKQMGETEMAKYFEDAAYHCEHHSFDLNFVGKFALSELTRDSGFKVVLTGEGSDENFAGYPMFVPDFLREPDLAYPQTTLPESVRQELFVKGEQEAKDVMAGFGGIPPPSEPSKGTQMLHNIYMPTAMTAFTFKVFESWATKTSRSDGCLVVAEGISEKAREQIMQDWHPLHSSEYVWCKGHLANQLLTCLGDRTEMGHSVEARTPFLDHILTEYVNSLPPSLKLRYDPSTGGLTEKWILREAMRPFITDELYRRKKHPYTAPPTWPTNGPLHNLFRRLLTEENVRQLGFVDWDCVRNALENGFENGDTRSTRICYMIGEWIVLAQRLGMDPAEPQNASFGAA